jgi:tight adherence protein B
MTPLLVAGLALLAWVLLPGDGRPSRLRPQIRQNRSAPRSPLASAGLVVAGLVVLAMLFGTRIAIWGGCVAVLAGTVVWLWRLSKLRKTTIDNRTEVARVCAVLAGRLEAGELPAAALDSVARDSPMMLPAATASHVGAGVGAQLRTIGDQPGCSALGQLADGWQLAERTGMALARIMRQLADSITQEAELSEAREAELSSARATGRLLTGLPVVGLLMGVFVGANPLAFITGTLFGQLCLLGACCLACAGLIWTEKMAESRNAG